MIYDEMKGSRKGAGFGIRTGAPAGVAVKNRGSDLISTGNPFTDLIYSNWTRSFCSSLFDCGSLGPGRLSSL
jgi:hypothetical protein